MAKPKLMLSTLIEEMGEEKFSAKFGVSPRSTRAYRYGERSPSPKSKLTKRLLAETELTWEDIYSS